MPAAILKHLVRTDRAMRSCLIPCVLVVGLLATGARAATRPNVVFILSDDLGYMDIGANNPKTFYETPNIDTLAKRGMRFTQGYAACQVCSPTRASIMTGKYPPRTGITDFIGGKREGRLKPAPNQDHLRAGRSDHRRAVSRRRLCHVLRRQVAPGRGRVFPQCARFRPRADRQRAVLLSAERRAAARLARRSQDHRSHRQRSGPLHRGASGRAVLRLFAVPGRAHADQGRARRWSRNTKPSRSPRRPTLGARSASERSASCKTMRSTPQCLSKWMRPSAACSRRSSAGTERADHRRLHFRQRRAVDVRRPSDVEHAAAGRQRLALRRRNSHPLDHLRRASRSRIPSARRP